MKNDLTPFEKRLLRNINRVNQTKFTYQHLMEWNTDASLVEKNLKEGEKIYEGLGVFAAIKH